MEVVVTTHAGVELEAATDYDSVSITPRMNGYADVKLDLSIDEAAAAEVDVASRAVKVYDGGALRFFGKVWEPLVYTESRVSVEARDPLAELLWRRVQALTSYVVVDAGAIAVARLAAQNARRNTFLRAGTVDVSAVRTREYAPGKREDEIFDELTALSEGFFYRALPVDNVSGVMADLRIYYPSAGVERDEVVFAYGEGTDDNVSSFTFSKMLPLNRIVAAGNDDLGARIFEVSDDEASIAEYGLFEDELAHTERATSAFLLANAKAAVRPAPGSTIEFTPTSEAPLLFDSFDVGDFVRIRIKTGALDLFEWVRVLEATLTVNRNGIRTLSNLVVEIITGGSVTISPANLWRARMDDERRRLEALERYAQAVDVTIDDPDDTPAPADDPDPGEPPPDIDEGTGGGEGEPPPPAPSDPPTIANLAITYATTTAITAECDVDGHGQTTEVTFRVDYPDGTTRRIVGPFGVGTGGHAAGEAATPRNTAVYVYAFATNASGTTQSGPVSTLTPNVDFE